MSRSGKTLVVALGGNAIADPAGQEDVRAQFARTATTAARLVELVRQGFRLVITHGNGPQVGDSLQRAELTSPTLQPLPLDVCVAETQGAMGYMIALSLTNALRATGLNRPVSTIITTVVVDPRDPAMKKPTKPIGREMTAEEARAHSADGWVMRRMPGGRFRRVVPSPAPVQILELPQIARLVEADELVIACGGGGIPVVPSNSDGYVGVAAVVDKDLASSLLAVGLGAEVMFLLTNVEHVYRDFGTLHAEPLRQLTVSQAKSLLADGQFPSGSMGPKITAAISFLEATPAADPKVILTSCDAVLEAASGTTGTMITRG